MTKNLQYKALWCVFIVGVILFNSFFVGGEDVFNKDSILSYNSVTKEVLLINTDMKSSIGSVKLNTPLVNVVPMGYQKVAEFEIKTYEDYLSVFQDMEFYDVKDGMKSIERTFDYKVKTIESYEEDEFIMNEKYQVVPTGKKVTRYREEWIPLDKSDFLTGDVKVIGIYTYVNEYDNVEWIGTYFGRRFDMWASYVQSSGTITTDGLYTIHTFTSNGTFNWTTADALNVSVLIVAGGGGGGGGTGGGGGGGGVIYNYTYLVRGNLNVVVGNGGIGGTGICGNGTIGQNSSFGSLTAFGGALGVSGGYGGAIGGSGSGGGWDSPNGKGGAGILGQGNFGGWGNDGTPPLSIGGGGGAGASGGNSTTEISGSGGDGIANTLYNGTILYYGGGGGSGEYGAGTSGAGSKGGGGAGGGANNGTANTGGGGGGQSDNSASTRAGNGGSGIVIVRYLTSDGVDFVPVTTLNSPTNHLHTTTIATTFNVTVTDEQKVQNVTLYIDGILNETDTSNVNGTYLFNKTLTLGSHNWSILAYNNNSNSNQSDTRLIGIYSSSEGTYTLTSFDVIAGSASYGITTNGTFFWIKDVGGDEVNLFFMNGTDTGRHWDTAGSGNGHIGGITQNDTWIWTTDTVDNKVYKFFMNGTFYNTFDGSVNCGIPSGITTDNNFLWTTSDGVQSVCKYFMNGTYTGSYFNTSITNGYGITQNSGFFWIADYDGGSVSKYFLDGTYTGFSFGTTSGNEYPTGMVLYNNIFYVTDTITDKVYEYLLIDTIPPTFTTIPNNVSLFYGNQSLNVTFIATDETGFSMYYINDTRFSMMNSTGWLTNATPMAIGNYEINVTINDTSNNIAWTRYKVQVNGSTINSETHNNLSYETARETFILNITTGGSVPTNANLVYDEVIYPLTVTNTIGNIYTLSKTLNINSTMIGTTQYYYEWNLSLTNKETTSNYTQEIQPILFGLCNATLTVPYINYTFKDTTTGDWINATIPSSTFVYYLGDGSVNKTLNYIQATEQSNYTFCALPSNQTFKIDATISYKWGVAYPQTTYNPDVANYTNSTTNTTLYLFGVGVGSSVTFQVLNTLNQPLTGVEVRAYQIVGETNYSVGTGTTDSAGTVTFYLNSDYTYSISLTKSGYEDYTILIQPTQSLYTITMSSSSTDSNAHENDYTRGILAYVYPSLNELENGTTYTFAFNVTSSYWDVSEFGFNLRLANGTIIIGDSSAIEGTAGSKLYNVNNQTIIYMDYYWIIEGQYTNSSTYWTISNTELTGWSIKTFFTDLTTYLDSNLFGLNHFGRYLIAFLVLFLTVGFMGYKFGMTNPIFISVLTFAGVFFLDVVTGILPSIRGINHLLTYVSGLVMALVIINEVVSR